jgi:hypothetical protein
MAELARSEQVKAPLYHAIGECLMAWAGVELQLQLIFLRGLEIDEPIADAIWTTPRSLDARLNLLNAAFPRSKAGRPVKSDFALLSAYVRLKMAQRNQVAHSTLIIRDGKTAVLEPYLALGTPMFKPA